MADSEIKPRTIADALGLTARKCTAIADTVKESFSDRSTIDALLDIKKMFTHEDERIYGIYAFSVMLGYKKAESKIKNDENEAFVAGQVIAVEQITKVLNQMAERGIITINKPDELNGFKDQNDSSFPDDLLSGTMGSEKLSVRNSSRDTSDNIIPDKKRSDSCNDPMYG